MAEITVKGGEQLPRRVNFRLRKKPVALFIGKPIFIGKLGRPQNSRKHDFFFLKF